MNELKEVMDPELYEQLYSRQDELLARSKRDQQQLVNDYATVFGSEEGLNVLTHIMEMCRINSSTFSGNSATYYFEGVQDVGKSIKRMIMEADPEIYFAVERRVWKEEQEARKA